MVGKLCVCQLCGCPQRLTSTMMRLTPDSNGGRAGNRREILEHLKIRRRSRSNAVGYSYISLKFIRVDRRRLLMETTFSTTLSMTLSTEKQGLVVINKEQIVANTKGFIRAGNIREMYFPRFGTERPGVQILSPRLFNQPKRGRCKAPVLLFPHIRDGLVIAPPLRAKGCAPHR